MQNERGVILVFVAIVLVVLIGMVGLVLDGGRIQTSQVQLQAAVDSVALGSIRIAPTYTRSDLLALANEKLNEELSLIGLTSKSHGENPTTVISLLPEDPNLPVRSVLVDVKAPISSLLLRFIDFSEASNLVHAQATGTIITSRIVVALDGSGSQCGDQCTAQGQNCSRYDCPNKAAVEDGITALLSTRTADDYFSLVKFSTSPSQVNAIRIFPHPSEAIGLGLMTEENKQIVTEAVEDMTFIQNTPTNMESGILLGLEQLTSIPMRAGEIGRLVVITDGVPAYPSLPDPPSSSCDPNAPAYSPIGNFSNGFIRAIQASDTVRNAGFAVDVVGTGTSVNYRDHFLWSNTTCTNLTNGFRNCENDIEGVNDIGEDVCLTPRNNDPFQGPLGGSGTCQGSHALKDRLLTRMANCYACGEFNFAARTRMPVPHPVPFEPPFPCVPSLQQLTGKPRGKSFLAQTPDELVEIFSRIGSTFFRLTH